MSSTDKDSDPGDGSADIVKSKFGISHFTDPGNEGSKSANDGDKAGKDDSAATVLFIKVLCPEKVLAIQQATGFSVKHFGAKPMTDGVVDAVPKNGGDEKDGDDEGKFDPTSPREGANGKKKGITRQEWGENEPGLTKDDEKEEAIDPAMILGNESL